MTEEYDLSEWEDFVAICSRTEVGLSLFDYTFIKRVLIIKR